jgi:hypothetical protein
MGAVVASIFVILMLPILAIFPTWFFAIRPYVARHHRPRVTAVIWLFSMWADWTTAREIEKSTGKRFWATRVFFWTWVYILILAALSGTMAFNR